MSISHWHKRYTAELNTSQKELFELISDLPNYGNWLTKSIQFGETIDVEPYPVRLGTKYHDGKPVEGGRSWLGKVTGFSPPHSIDFNQTLFVKELRAKVDVFIHYSIEPSDNNVLLNRWLLLEIDMPILLRPFRGSITKQFDNENVRLFSTLSDRCPSVPK